MSSDLNKTQQDDSSLLLTSKVGICYTLCIIGIRVIGIIFGSVWYDQCDSFGLAFYILLSSCLGLMNLLLLGILPICSKVLLEKIDNTLVKKCIEFCDFISQFFNLIAPTTDFIVGVILIWANFDICSSELVAFSIIFIILSCYCSPLTFMIKKSKTHD